MGITNASIESEKMAVAGLGGCFVNERDLFDWWQHSDSSTEEPCKQEKARFDAALFRMSKEEASKVNPVELAFMEAAWSALQQAGCMRATGGQLSIYSDSGLIQQRAVDQLMTALQRSAPVTLTYRSSKQDLLLELSSRISLSASDTVLFATAGSKGVGAFVIRPWHVVEREQLSITAALYTNGEDVRLERSEHIPDIQRTEMLAQARDGELLMLAAHTSSALETVTDQLADYLRQHENTDLGDLAISLCRGAGALPERRVLVPSSTQEAIDILSDRDSLRYWDSPYVIGNRKLIFMFSGLGDHYENMSRDIYEQEPVFRSAIDSCCEFLQPLLGFDLRTKLFPVQASTSSKEGEGMNAVPNIDIRSMLRRNSAESASRQQASTLWVHPALFTVEYALTRLLDSWGIKPHGLIGHSLGEYTAACMAGVFTLEQALTIVAKRAQLIGTLEKGTMLAVTMTESEAAALLPESVTIALVNSPESLVLSGPLDGIEEMEQRLARLGKLSTRLSAEYAFHSRMMEPAAAALSALISDCEPKPPTIPFLSNVTGTWITAEQATNPEYWAEHLCQTVRFSDGIHELLQDQETLFVEIGPGQSLCSFVHKQRAEAESERLLALPTLRHAYDRTADRLFLLRTIGQLWINGIELCVETVYQQDSRQLALPTYPFERMPLYEVR